MARRGHFATAMIMRLLPAAALLALAFPVLAAPVPQGAPNVPAFKPAFAGQTRAPAVTTRQPLKVTTIATGLNKPWAVALLPDGGFLVTEKAAGTIRRIAPDGTKSAPLAGTPKVDARDQGGMMDLVLAPDFGASQMVYFTYAEPRQGGNGLAVARGKLSGSAGTPRLEGVEVVFRVQPTLASTKHYGGRLVFAADGTLFVTTGERSILPGRAQAQRLDSDFGKVLRINPDGSIPRGNPYAGKPGARPEIWSIGHRNILSAALDARGQLWEVEMGPQGGDELNKVMPGKDYGWPTIGYGEEYSGAPVGKGITSAPGMEQPVYYWDPVISPSGMVIYAGSMFPEWSGNVLIGGLSSKALVRLVLANGKVIGEERLLTDRGARIRDVREGPDGALYILTDSADGQLWKVTAG